MVALWAMRPVTWDRLQGMLMWSSPLAKSKQQKYQRWWRVSWERLPLSKCHRNVSACCSRAIRSSLRLSFIWYTDKPDGSLPHSEGLPSAGGEECHGETYNENAKLSARLQCMVPCHSSIHHISCRQSLRSQWMRLPEGDRGMWDRDKEQVKKQGTTVEENRNAKQSTLTWS